jgi:hypothetical protein
MKELVCYLLTGLIFMQSSLLFATESNEVGPDNQASCTKRKMIYDENLQRCTYAQSATNPDSDIAAITQEVEKSADIANDMDRQLQELNIATSYMPHKKTSYGKNAPIEAAVSGAKNVISSFLLLNYLFYKNSKGLCVPRLLLGIGAGLAISEEIFRFTLFEKTVREKQDAYIKIREKNPWRAQSTAFRILRDEQQMIADLNMKIMISQTALSLIYSSALTAAVIQLATGTSASCLVQTQKMIIPQPLWTLIIPQSFATSEDDIKGKLTYGDGWTRLLASRIGPAAAGGILGGLAGSYGFLSGLQGVIVGSGLLIASSVALFHMAYQERQDALQNVQALKKITDQMEAMDGSQCLSDDKEDMSNVRCFCYTDTGQQRTDRTQSSTCQNAYNETAAADMLLSGMPNFENGGCAFINGQPDPTCKCRDYKTQGSARNACLNKDDLSALLAPGQLSAQEVDLAGKYLDVKQAATSGQSLGVSSTLLQGASRQLRALKDQPALAEKFRDILLSDKMNEAKKLLTKAQKDIADNAAQMPAPFKGNSQLQSLLPQQKAPEAAASEQNEATSLTQAKGKTAARSVADQKKMSWDLEASGSKVLDLGAEDQAKYKVDAVIHKDHQNIWDIVSHRYKQTALPRLFAE